MNSTGIGFATSGATTGPILVMGAPRAFSSYNRRVRAVQSPSIKREDGVPPERANLIVDTINGWGRRRTIQ